MIKVMGNTCNPVQIFRLFNWHETDAVGEERDRDAARIGVGYMRDTVHNEYLNRSDFSVSVSKYIYIHDNTTM